jgi:predicted secreted protein
MCRQQSRGRGGVHDWNITEALPGAAAYEGMYTLYGGWTERGASLEVQIRTSSKK